MAKLTQEQIKEPTKKQIEEFWEGYGFEEKDFGEFVYGPLMHGGKIYEKAWFAPNGDNWLDELPRIDLKNLFRYAVPKLSGFEMYKHAEYIGGKRLFYKVIVHCGYSVGIGDSEDPALALYQALDEVRRASK